MFLINASTPRSNISNLDGALKVLASLTDRSMKTILDEENLKSLGIPTLVSFSLSLSFYVSELYPGCATL
jgi:hypothetical protein